VVFDDVSFGYQAAEPVLKHVSLHAAAGQTIALVGPTGAGKTTIVNLLTRFYDIDSGAISIDGMDIRTLKLADLRRKLGIVLQDTYLFADTVMENIRYGRWTPPMRKSSPPRNSPTPTSSSTACRRATRRSFQSGPATSARGSGNCSPSRGRSWPIRAS
jgi:ABC-type proline/glycine betaine transport system ATPase subunit